MAGALFDAGAENGAAYRVLADRVIDLFNPSAGDVAEEVLLGLHLRVVAEFVASMACTCPAGAFSGAADPCTRCMALGRGEDQVLDHG